MHWQPWEAAVFDEARRRNVPVWSIGYAACHWCHVMAHENFEDEEVAALMAHFVCISSTVKSAQIWTGYERIGHDGRAGRLTIASTPMARVLGRHIFPRNPAASRLSEYERLARNAR